MKNILFMFIIFSTCLFSQGWNNIVTTTINEPNLLKMGLFTNKDGNHIIVQNSNSTNSIKYYLLNSSGSVIRSATIETSGGAEFPNVSGDNNNIYLVYKSGNYLKAKKSTDAGQNWNNITIQPLSIGNYTCNGVDIVNDYNGLHIVYSTQPDGLYDAETYYYRINSNNQWVDYKNVTDYGNEVGGVPTISVSNNRINVSYSDGSSAKTRDKVGNDWQNPQLVSDGEVGNVVAQKIQVKNDKLFCIYFDLWVDLGQYGFDIQVKSRDLSATSWPSSYNTIFNSGWPNVGIGAETTSNGTLHIIDYGFDNGIVYKYFDGNNWSNSYSITSDNIYYDNSSIGFSTASNDLFCTWKPDISDYLKYRQYDIAPLTPNNLSISIVNEESVLSWEANLEPDVNITGGKYKIYRAETSGELPTSFQLAATINAYSNGTPVTSWTDIESGKSYTKKLFYKISAVDKNLHESELTDYVWRYGKLPKILTDQNKRFEYALFNNYPNPFNPTTKIVYSIKEEGLVILKVYDILGKEVSTLVNEYKPEGSYETEFNASSLPSGMYIYKLQAGEFSDIKKMILTK